MPDAEYHATQAISFHFLLDVENRGPAYAIGRLRGRVAKAPSDAFRVGTLCHLAVLEGDEALASRTMCVPPTYWTDPPEIKPWSKRAKYCKEWEAANPDKPTPENYPDGPGPEEKEWNWNAGPCKRWKEQAEKSGKIIMDAGESGMVINMRRAALEVAESAAILRMGIPEISFLSHEHDAPIKARMDWISAKGTSVADWLGLHDLKTCESVDDFMDEAWRYLYHRQMAWYQWIIQQDVGVVLPVSLLALEKGWPHRCRVYDIPEDILADAHAANMRTLDLALDLWRRDTWPKDLAPSRQVFRAPGWVEARKAREAQADPY
jgi:hypothetical protein